MTKQPLLVRLAMRIPAVRRGLVRAGWRPMRAYSGASTGRLTFNWPTTGMWSDQEIRTDIATLRNRARNMVNSDSYGHRFLSIQRMNIPGPLGFKLQMRVMNDNGMPDRPANMIIEREWERWMRPGNCTVDGRMSFVDVQHVCVNHWKRDGEFLVRKIRTKASRWGFQLQVLEPDMLDHNKNETLSNGNVIRLGIETDSARRPVAYWLRRVSNTTQWYVGDIAAEWDRVPADEILYAGRIDRAFQTRSVTTMAPGMLRLNHLAQYEDASVINAEVAAKKLGFFSQSPDAAGQWSGDDLDGDGNRIMDADPGSFTELPPGTSFHPWSPEFPHASHEPFMKRTLRGLAAGWDIAYNLFANDLEGVNYSSIRAGLVDERENWKGDQRWMIDHFMQPVFESWLEMAMMSGALPFPMSRFDKMNAAEFIGRRWAWVDPEKDVKAKALERAMGLTSLSRIAAESGLDLEDIFIEIAADQKLAAKYGITLYNGVQGGSTGEAATPAGAEPDDDDSNGESGPRRRLPGQFNVDEYLTIKAGTNGHE